MKAAPCLLWLGLALAASGIAVAQKQAEPTQHLPWVIAEAVETVPFSFVYDGRSSRDLLPQWEQKRTSQALPGNREHEVVTWRDGRSGLQVIYERTVYRDRQAIDWVVRLHNAGTADTPILEKVRSLDLELEPPGSGDVLLHQAGGGLGVPPAEDFLLKENKLTPGASCHMVHYVTKDGKTSGGEIPYFDLQWPQGGVVGAVGWSGQWEIQVSRSLGRKVSLQTGQQDVHLKLHPGESIRTPSMLLVQWSGQEPTIGHNLFRRLLVDYYLPRIAGQVTMPPVSATTAYVLLFDAIAQKTGKNPLQVLPTLTQDDLTPKHGMPTSGMTRSTPSMSRVSWITSTRCHRELKLTGWMPVGSRAAGPMARETGIRILRSFPTD
jgi:alpha-galactosidase